MRGSRWWMEEGRRKMKGGQTVTMNLCTLPGHEALEIINVTDSRHGLEQR